MPTPNSKEFRERIVATIEKAFRDCIDMEGDTSVDAPGAGGVWDVRGR